MSDAPIQLDDRARRAIHECLRIAAMTEVPGSITRGFLTPPMHDVHAYLRARMESMGMRVRVDAIGNLRGLWRPAGAAGKRLLLSSHLDTVPDAGAFDGILGVVLAIEWVGIAQDLRLPLALEVVGFSEEEGVRYAAPFLGSRAFVGDFDSSLLARVDAAGVHMAEAIRAFGLDPAKIAEAAFDGDVLGYIEVHIEQGPVLEAQGLSVAVVEAVAGQSRLTFTFEGHANHAGTTPMPLRRDALAGAAEWILEVETSGKSAPHLVATVGKINAMPNASNVVPGLVSVGLDVRSTEDATRIQAVERLTNSATEIARRRGLGVHCEEHLNQAAVPLDAALTDRLKCAVQQAGLPLKTMASGAGHDAMVMASRLPAAMLFVRSPGGISHHPDETVREEDVAASLKVAREFLVNLAADLR